MCIRDRPVGEAPFALALEGTRFGFDFNPAADRIRVVGGTDNRRMHPDTGMVVDADAAAADVQLDGALAYATGDVNAGKAPVVVAAAYTNPDADAATGTTNYAIDTAADALVTQGTKEGVTPAVSPNAGTLFTVGCLLYTSPSPRDRTRSRMPSSA